MNKIYFAIVFLGLQVNQLYCLQTIPWFYEPYEFHAGGSIEGSFFSNVQNGINPIGYHSNNLLLEGYALAPISENWEIEAEVQFERTSKTSFNFLSVALQARTQLLNDIAYDWVSFAVGINARFVPDIWLKDVAIPYHNLFDFEVIGSLGKEFAENFKWKYRTYLYLAVGQANKGYPWFRGGLEFAWKVLCKSILNPFVKGYFGVGNQTLVNVDCFRSYASIRHQSIDIGLAYIYLFDIWGSLTFEYSYRVFARSFPERLNVFKLTYDIPFGF